jgi:hypothetical protein
MTNAQTLFFIPALLLVWISRRRTGNLTVHRELRHCIDLNQLQQTIFGGRDWRISETAVDHLIMSWHGLIQQTANARCK